MTGIGIDASELKALGSTIIGGTAMRRAKITAAVKKGAQNIKEDILSDVRSSGNAAFRRIPIRYDIRQSGFGISAEISPVKGGAGSLANIAFFGTARGGGTHDFYAHGQDELPRLAEYVAKAGLESL